MCCNCRRESATTSPTPAPPMITERRGVPENVHSNSARAKYAGVGIVFQGVRGEALVVQSLTPGGPAELSGRVEVGDVLFTINESKVAEMDDSEYDSFEQQDSVSTNCFSAGELARSLLGPTGSKVVLGLQRGSNRRMNIELTRAWPAQQ